MYTKNTYLIFSSPRNKNKIILKIIFFIFISDAFQWKLWAVSYEWRGYKIYMMICHLLPSATDNEAGERRRERKRMKMQAASQSTITGFVSRISWLAQVLAENAIWRHSPSASLFSFLHARGWILTREEKEDIQSFARRSLPPW